MDWVQTILTGIIAAVPPSVLVYTRSYLGEKGKNRATKEDIDDLTRKVEEVRSEYAHGLAELSASLSARTTLRMLAGERRLATHQEAYSRRHLLLLRAAFDDGERYADECAMWWRDNALFLDAGPRDRFILAVGAARVHRMIIETNRDKGPDGAARVVANMDIIRATGPSIVQACDLPPLAIDAAADIPADPGQVAAPIITYVPGPNETL